MPYSVHSSHIMTRFTTCLLFSESMYCFLTLKRSVDFSTLEKKTRILSCASKHCPW